MKVAKPLSLLTLAACLFLASGTSFASVNNVYISQNGGTFSGGTACNGQSTQAYTYFNTSSNWTSGTPSGSQIGPGTSVYICGTIDVPEGATALSVHGSGSSTAPVTILFDTGAIIESPAFTNGININGYNYITVNGGTNGIIENTANGTNLSYQTSSQGVNIQSASDITVESLTIQNIYVNAGSSPSATDTNGQNTADVNITYPASNLIIQNNTLTNARTGIVADFDGGNITNLAISGNTLSDHCWQIQGGGNTTGIVSGLLIYGNSMTGWLNWQYPTSTYHQDGIILYSDSGTPFTVYVYNNYFYGDMGEGSSTGMLFITTPNNEYDPITTYAFNNVFYDSVPYDDPMWIAQTIVYAYNNTFVGSGGGVPIMMSDGSSTPSTAASANAENNVFINFSPVYLDEYSLLTNWKASNYNDFNAGSSGVVAFDNSNFSGNGPNWTFSQWQAEGFDANSTTGAPNLSSSYTLQSGSAAIGLGTNLTSLCTGNLVPLCSDKAGNPRPSTGNWDAGAYNYASDAPAPPTGLTAVAH
jgi:hypothetical protein